MAFLPARHAIVTVLDQAAPAQMNFDAWTDTTGDPVRRKRLLFGYVIGVVSVVLVGAFVVLTSTKAQAGEDEEPAIEAQLAKEPEPEPEPEPPPPPPADAPKPTPKPKIKAPSEIPLEPLKEAEANKSALSDDTDPFQRAEKAEPVKPAEPAVVAPPPPPPKPVLKPEKKGPIRVTEDVTPPVPNSTNSKPDYPADAKAKGVEGVVIVKYVVSEAGVVTDAQILKGPPELGSVCLAAVKTWRFQPALLDGKAVAVVRVARFPFRIKT